MTGLTGQERCGRTSYHPVMKTSGITAALPAQDLGRAKKTFYVERVGLQALESPLFRQETGRWASWLEMVSASSSVSRPGQVVRDCTQVVIHVTDVRTAVEEMRDRGVEFEEYDTPETQTENGVAGCRVEATRRGSRTRKATSSALSQPEEKQRRKSWPVSNATSGGCAPTGSAT